MGDIIVFLSVVVRVSGKCREEKKPETPTTNRDYREKYLLL